MTRALLLAYCPLCGDRYKKERIGEDNHTCLPPDERGDEQNKQDAARCE